MNRATGSLLAAILLGTSVPAQAQWLNVPTKGIPRTKDGKPDALVVDSTGFNGEVWFDTRGHPSTDALHITERFRWKDFGHLDIQITIDDSKAYTKPWTATVKRRLLADTDPLEFVCNENEKDSKHYVGK